MTTTTIRVSKQLHDRLSRHAREAGTTLAGAIQRALDAEERAAFWSAAQATMGSAEQRRARQEEAESFDTNTDGLEPESWEDVW